jgi:hypothetical protein
MIELSGYFLNVPRSMEEGRIHSWPEWVGPARIAKRIYVTPEPGLRIASHPAKSGSKTCEETVLDLQVVDTKGRGVPAVLGLTVVDADVLPDESCSGIVRELLATALTGSAPRPWLAREPPLLPVSLASSPSQLSAHSQSRLIEACFAAAVAGCEQYAFGNRAERFRLQASTGMVKHFAHQLWRGDYFFTLGFTNILCDIGFILFPVASPIFIILLVGISVGLYSGLKSGWVDNLIMRIGDVILAFPDLLFFVIVMAVGQDYNIFLVTRLNE